jgi:phage shock protein PspC (stress-responsive transcriptional regulator)
VRFGGVRAEAAAVIGMAVGWVEDDAAIWDSKSNKIVYGVCLGLLWYHKRVDMQRETFAYFITMVTSYIYTDVHVKHKGS